MEQNKIVKPFIEKEIPVYEKAEKGSYGFFMSKGEGTPVVNEASFFINQKDFKNYLQYFVVRAFNKNLPANALRSCSLNRNENYFHVNKENNFYTYNAISKIIESLKNTIQCFMIGRETDFTKNYSYILNSIRTEVLGKDRLDVKGHYTWDMYQAFSLEVRILINFYNRVIIKLEKLITTMDDRGCNLISIIHP